MFLPLSQHGAAGLKKTEKCAKKMEWLSPEQLGPLGLEDLML